MSADELGASSSSGESSRGLYVPYEAHWRAMNLGLVPPPSLATLGHIARPIVAAELLRLAAVWESSAASTSLSVRDMLSELRGRAAVLGGVTDGREVGIGE